MSEKCIAAHNLVDGIRCQCLMMIMMKILISYWFRVYRIQKQMFEWVWVYARNRVFQIFLASKIPINSFPSFEQQQKKNGLLSIQCLLVHIPSHSIFSYMRRNIENDFNKTLGKSISLPLHPYTYDGILLHLAYAIKSIESIQFIGHIYIYVYMYSSRRAL